MQKIETTEKNKINIVNLPCIITFVVFIIGFASLIIGALLDNVNMFYFKVSTICILCSIVSVYTICPISLIFQFLNKNKNKLDKWLLGLNLAGVIFFISTLIFVIFAFPNEFKGEKEVRVQINQEYSILNKEYQSVLDYLKNYKKEHGVYPDSLDEKIIPKSDCFDMYKYHTTYNGKGYWLQVYPKNGPIEYYYNDENDKNVNYYDGDGYIDGALDNDYFYKIDEKWHAIMLQHLTRHSLFWNGGQTEREVDEWMKNDVEKFEE